MFTKKYKKFRFCRKSNEIVFIDKRFLVKYILISAKQSRKQINNLIFFPYFLFYNLKSYLEQCINNDIKKKTVFTSQSFSCESKRNYMTK